MTTQMNSMPMYFSPWEYGGPLQLLWSTWQIQTPWQFALSWLAVAACAVVYHLSECVLAALDKANMKLLVRKGELVHLAERNDAIADAEAAIGREVKQQQEHRAPTGMTYIPRPAGWAAVKLLRATVAAVRYLLGLMMMLVAMTFNPSLFLALVVGYLAGDYLCYDYRLDRCLSGSPHMAAQVRRRLFWPPCSAPWTDGPVHVIARAALPLTTSPPHPCYPCYPCYPCVLAGQVPRHKLHSAADDVVATAVVRALLLMPQAPQASRYEQTNDDLHTVPAAAGVRALQYGLWALPRVASLTFFIVLLAWIVQVCHLAPVTPPYLTRI